MSVRLPLPVDSRPAPGAGSTRVWVSGAPHRAEWEVADGSLTLRGIGGEAGPRAVAGPVLAQLARGFGVPLRGHDTPPRLKRSLVLGSSTR
jgi:hypothetical protein